MKKQAVKTGGKVLRTFSASLSRKCQKGARRAGVFLLCILLILCLCSCWSQRELNTLAIVLGTALDVGDQPDTLTLTAQVVKASELGSGTSTKGGGSEGKAYVNVSYTDSSVLAAVRELTRMQNRRLYFAHNEVLIFSSDLEKKDIAEGLDVFIRDYETRMNINILISKGKASEILNENVELEKIPALHISKLMGNQKSNSETVTVTLRDFAIAILSDSAAPVAPMVKLYESEGKKYAKLEGTAVFKKGKMIGELNTEQTRGVLWVTNKAQSGEKTVNTPWGQVTLEILHSSSNLKPVKGEDGTIRMKLTIDVEGAIQGNETAENMSRPENVAMLKGRMEDAVRSDVGSALAQARALSADVLGFGEAIRREYPEEWEKMKGNWDQEFPKIGMDVQVNAELGSEGGLVKPVTPGGAQ
ncbi:Ger(x)C family spore germination protein [Caproiciproducens sp. CPB-2]|uniref:Ger(x)C family spore germination protein n=1 Tax=Caproiciproducens sp. CPB-2 TaxID=3030017 RepID=UPI0023DB0680|nr:Ger(x)C family spore germination protein [Caproiciproducens sp. CPB-2]MDF1495245.1 Ger(x)C family spore germination protein [Caproiciproducens sp. CPB-2]